MYINITRRVNRYGLFVTNIHLRSNRLAEVWEAVIQGSRILYQFEIFNPE